MERNADAADILLAEDSPGDVRLIQEAFAEAGIPNNLHIVADGEEAVRFVRRSGPYADAPRPDLILLDLNMPRMRGGEVLGHLKGDADLRTIPIVVLTTSSAEDDVRMAYGANANCFLTKPTDLDELVETVTALGKFWLEAATLPPKR